MATIKAFKGIRYAPEAGRLEDLTTPPYDVIGKNAEASFASRNQYNIIRLDITKDPGSDKNEDPGRYSRPAQLLKTWIQENILIKDKKEGLYPYDIQYKLPGGRTLVRKGFIGLIKLAEFKEGIVKPHEKTFTTVTGDRLELMRACRAQFSQVFSCFSDPANKVIDLLSQHRGDPVSVMTDADDCMHSLYRVCNEKIIEAVRQEFVNKCIYIADGHHRYQTALSYRNELLGENENLDRPEAFIMMYLCPMEDQGLSILAPHRLLRYPGYLALDQLLGRLRRFFEIEEVRGASRELLLGELLSRMQDFRELEDARKVFGFYHPGEDRSFLLILKNESKHEIGEHHDCLQDLDVVILSSLVIQKSLELSSDQIEQKNLLTYHSDIHEALDISVKISAAREDTTPLLFLINPTSIGQVKRVSDEGLFMPHKSTYFFPKIVSGMVMNVFSQQD